MSGSQSASGPERGSSIRRARMAPTREVVDLAKRVEADASGPVDDNEARSAPELVPAHRDGQGDPGVVSVHADRERYAVLVQ